VPERHDVLGELLPVLVGLGIVVEGRLPRVIRLRQIEEDRAHLERREP
jgi:hypothetical protein